MTDGMIHPRTAGAPGYQGDPSLVPASVPTYGVHETASTAAAAQAESMVKARYQMALLRPRNMQTVRLRVLDNCKRHGFAEVAKYSKPVGNTKVVGPSIRFVEQALRDMGNTLVESMVIYDDEAKRIVRVSVTDLECNLSYPQDIVIEKRVERSFLKDGQSALGQRLTSKGKVVYLVEATEDEMLNKVNNLTSKAIRSNGLRLIPGDIVEEAMVEVDSTLRQRDQNDPKAAIRRICDSFHTMGVTPDNIVEYLGHAIEQSTPAELQDLRQVFSALRDGEATWVSIMDTREKPKGPKTPAAPKALEGQAELAGEPQAQAAPEPAATAPTQTVTPDRLKEAMEATRRARNIGKED